MTGPRTTQLEHALTVWQRPVEGSLTGECVCGWRGPKRATREKAEEDWLDHSGAPELVLRPVDVNP